MYIPANSRSTVFVIFSIGPIIHNDCHRPFFYSIPFYELLAYLLGGLLLPILGGLPDAIMILVSGMSADTNSEAQQQVAVGMGTLAGSTIMLLTVPWSLSLILGRTDFDREGNAIDRQCKTPFFFKGNILSIQY